MKLTYQISLTGSDSAAVAEKRAKTRAREEFTLPADYQIETISITQKSLVDFTIVLDMETPVRSTQ